MWSSEAWRHTGIEHHQQHLGTQVLGSRMASHTCCMLSHFSRVRLFVTPRTVACQALLSMGFSRQQYWSGLPCPPQAHTQTQAKTHRGEHTHTHTLRDTETAPYEHTHTHRESHGHTHAHTHMHTFRPIGSLGSLGTPSRGCCGQTEQTAPRMTCPT